MRNPKASKWQARLVTLTYTILIADETLNTTVDRTQFSPFKTDAGKDALHKRESAVFKGYLKMMMGRLNLGKHVPKYLHEPKQ